jgi:hypothetical protein
MFSSRHSRREGDGGKCDWDNFDNLDEDRAGDGVVHADAEM